MRRSGNLRVRASRHGRFRTRGRYGSASVRGATGVTEDNCDGTLVSVKRGKVAVRDRHRTILVRAGKSYLARARI
jgi:ferric-dicitrate binding protein FerR (iron transport regulator)